MNALASSDLSLSAGVDAQNPWPGLAPFTEKLKDFFHGRAEEADELLRRVGRKDLTVLFGQSGLGKSSLLQAGLFPRLREKGHLPVPIRLDHAATAPPLSEQVKAAVARAIEDMGGSADNMAAVAGDTLWEHFHRRGLRMQTLQGEPVRLVLVLDQFEELFAIGQASEETRDRAAHFLSELADLIENRVPKALEERLEESPALARQFALDDRGYRALICLREDYLPHLESLRPSMPSIAENRMRLTRMNGLRALDAVLAPGGGLVAPEVGRQIVRFVAGGRLREAVLANGKSEDEELARLEVEPSLLSLVCRELNNHRLNLGLPQITADLLAGNRERILQDYYERCLADQPSAVRVFVEDELVTDSGLRENIALERARKTLTQGGALPTAIDELVKRRLLHIEDRLDIQRVELTHDVLTAVVKKSRDQRQQQEATLRAEQQAQEAREKARRQRHRLRWIVAGMAVALVVVGSLAVEGWSLYRVSKEALLEAKRQKNEAERQKSEAEHQKERAEETQKLADRSFDEARGTVDELLTEMSQEGLRGVPGLQELRQRFAQKAADRYEIYVGRRPNDPDVTAGYARSLIALGRITGQLGSVEQAVSILERAIKIGDELVRRQPENLEYQYRRACARSALGGLYWELNQFQKARPHLQQAARELEAAIRQKPTKEEYRLELASIYNTLGNVSDDRAERRRHFERARDLAQEVVDHHPSDPKSLEYLMPPIGNLASLTREEGDYLKALELEDRCLVLLESVRRRFPLSANLLRNRGLSYDHKGDTLVKLKRPEEATRCYEQSVESHRLAVLSNPLDGRHRSDLAKELLWLAADENSRGLYSKAKAHYEESCRTLEALTQRSDDRAMYGTDLIESWLRFSYFHEGIKVDQQDLIAQKQGQLRCLDQAVQHGRRLSKQFPDAAELQYKFAEALLRRALYDSEDGRSKEAFPFFLECLETFRNGVITKSYKPTPSQLVEFLKWIDDAQDCAEKLKQIAEIKRLAHLASELSKSCNERDGIQALGYIFNRAAKAHKEANQYKEAVEWNSHVLQVCKPVFEKATWDWYLRRSVSEAYKNMAESYSKLGDYPNEVLSWREYLKVWSGPMEGMKIEDYINPARKTNEAEAIRLRHFVKSSPGMKTVAVETVFSGLKYQINVQITNVPWPKDPLEDQARWWKQVRDGIISEESRESIRKIQKIAYQNNVGLVELLRQVYPDTTNSKKEELEKTKKEIVAQIVNLRETLKNAPNDAGTKASLAEAYQRLAKIHSDFNLNELREAIKAYEQSRLLLEEITRQPSASVKLHERLGDVYLELGNIYAYDRVKEYEKAYTLYQRHHEVLERLSRVNKDERKWRTRILQGYRALGSLCGKAFDPADGAVWYLKAIDQDDTEAAEGLASLYLEHPEVVAVVPEPARKLLLQEAEKSKKDPRTFPTSFAQGMQLFQLRKTADRFHELAEAEAAKGRKDEYRKALSKEFDTCGKLVKLNPASWDLRDAQSKVAVEIARSYLDSKETKAVVEWTTRAAEVGHVESLLQLADWYEKGTYVKADLKKAKHYRYVGHLRRGYRLFGDHRFQEALPELQQACNSEEADAEDHDNLGMCYGKLGRWDEAIKAYTRSIELDIKSDAATGHLLNLLEALTAAERPEQLLQFLQTIEKKGWKLPKEGTNAAKYTTLYHGFRAIALHMSGKDASDAERLMRQYTGKPDYKMTGWIWDELDQWLKTTKLEPERKVAVEKILAELKGPKSK